MCGILGLVARRADNLNSTAICNAVRHLFLLSESRGKESSGLAAKASDSLTVIKSAMPASQLVTTREYRSTIRELWGDSRSEIAAMIGHARLVTDGGQDDNSNNQPVVCGNVVGIHNGIVVNVQEIWNEHSELHRQSDVDSEAIFSLLNSKIASGKSISAAAIDTFAEIEGQASVAAIFSQLNYLLLYTNHGSLFTTSTPGNSLIAFASERSILAKAFGGFIHGSMPLSIRKVQPNTGLLIDLGTLNCTPFNSSTDFSAAPAEVSHSAAPIRLMCPPVIRKHQRSSLAPYSPPSAHLATEFKSQFQEYKAAIQPLPRCRKCILPYTMPFIKFDDDGICNYCSGYKSARPRPAEELEAILAPIRRNDGNPDCLVGLSGGRDSCYALHVIKTQLGLNPIAFTYDWGMVTDLARRNISRMCGALGIEHVLVSADILRKRSNVRRNLSAWLTRPDLGMIPLLMAGDKHYFYHANRLKEEMGIKLTILGENLLERTDFKTGFCGVTPGSKSADRVYVLGGFAKAQMLMHYAFQFARTTGYWNSSLFDTLSAFGVYYLLKKEYLNLYRYVQWDETTVENILRNTYNWEFSPDTRSSWRIGDGTASLYNYIYYTVAGFSEVDTFRSNQIREGVLTRESAVSLADEENEPRFPSIKQYCELIGVDFEHAIRTINKIPRLYPYSQSEADLAELASHAPR